MKETNKTKFDQKKMQFGLLVVHHGVIITHTLTHSLEFADDKNKNSIEM